MEQPTFNAIIEPHPAAAVVDLTTAEPELPLEPIKPYRQSALLGDDKEIKVEKFELPSPPCCPMLPPPPTELQAANVSISNLFEALLTSFAVGALTGIAVSYALSRRVVVEFE